MEKTKKVLVFGSQPPGSNGVQAARYSKLVYPLERLGWKLYFVGPDPKLGSVVLEPLRGAKCYYASGIPWSRRFSVYRHRLRKSAILRRATYGACQAVSMQIERLFGRDNKAELIKHLKIAGDVALSENDFDLIVGDCPDFEMLSFAASAAKEAKLPLLAFYEDPFGARELDGFTPHLPEQQKAVIMQAGHTVFASPLTRTRYIDCGLAKESSSSFISDSFDYPKIVAKPVPVKVQPKSGIKLLHLGNLAIWRPIEAFLETLEKLNSGSDLSVEFQNFGLCYPAAEKVIRESQSLKIAFRQYGSVSWEESHNRAADADILVTIIGPRHQDNCPSKFFEYMGHCKPMLLLGPEGNPCQAMIEQLGIGIYASISDATEIENALLELISNAQSFQDAYFINADQIQCFNVESVANDWASVFEQAVVANNN